MRFQAARIAWLALVEVGCIFSPASEVPGTFCKSQLVIAAEGGTVTVTGPACPALAGTTVVIPPNALARDTVIAISAGPDTIAPDKAIGVGPVVDLGPGGTAFGTEATVTLPYTSSALFNPHHLFIATLDATGATGRIDPEVLSASGKASFSVGSFTQFQVVLDIASCDHCPVGASCAPETDHCACAPGHFQCNGGGACIDARTDPDNCGSCGNVCEVGYLCSGGQCVSSCPSGLDVCPTKTSFACLDLQSDSSSCGACGTVCATGYLCSAGRCVSSCQAGLNVCPTPGSFACVDLQSDSANCGACANVCSIGYTCAGANCVNTCDAGLKPCAASGGFACVDVQSDSSNCGACGVGCGSSGVAACIGGKCTCGTPGLTACINSTAEFCADLQTDKSHCGTCSHSCSSHQCIGGVCFCSPGTLYCTDWANLDHPCVVESDRNCGKCGHKCSKPLHCVSGRCSL